MWYLYGVVLIAGIANAIQPGQNAALAKGFSQPLTAGLVVGICTATTVLVVGLVTGRLAWPSSEDLATVPWWGWFGGVFGGGIVIAQLLVARQIGAGAFLGLLVTAGVVASVLLDHFGWVGFAVHPATPWRILGGVLMIGGVALVALF
ncbi:DMT family transporter [Methylobacterium sp. E-041]|uniref:DMT family transporter n=1 Tax=unclassified Methylobacterium TaxID=2615210 RepID=UPI001FB96002|nr:MULTISPECIES: DMT family transporter [unclassified Methylobacterium]MCJ2006170.1 DMT family transporter [Methylobacterium sp. J-092]MCJ2039031.1 DMT family transporter [Methylobacterium sp. J-059]MCJ2105636.1 DMT family transporter [Methylobacterium sp. E-041]